MTDVKIMKQESENFDIEFPSDTAVPKRVKLSFRSTSHYISVEIRVRYLVGKSRYTISARFMITHVQYENRNTFTCLLIDSFCSTTFSLVPFVRSLFLTYVQRISHKNAGWSIIRAIHLGDTRGFAAIKRFLMCAAQVRMKTYGNLKSHKTFDADVFAHLYRMPPKKQLIENYYYYYSVGNKWKLNKHNVFLLLFWYSQYTLHWSKIWNALNLQYVDVRSCRQVSTLLWL